jgi:acetyl esterase/lipase
VRIFGPVHALAPVLTIACLPALFAAADADPRHFTMKVWPHQPPGSRVDPNYVETIIYRDNDPAKPRHSQVTDPTLEVFLAPADKANGSAVVICPGGGYSVLAYDHEGIQVARWFNAIGIAGVILKYRLPSDAIMADKSVGPLQDAQEAIRLVRRNAAAWGIDPKRIGILGFSAGGHLAATASTLFAEKVYEPADKASARPDFSILVYPVISMQTGVSHGGSRANLLGPDPDVALCTKFSADERVGPQTPPAFLIHSADDGAVPLENSLRYCLALRNHGVAGELHVYPRGGHGYGLGINPDSPASWPEVLKLWLQANGW